MDNKILMEFNSIIFDQSLAVGDRLQRLASRIAQIGTEEERKFRSDRYAEEVSLQKILMESFWPLHPHYPTGTFGWSQAALEASLMALNKVHSKATGGLCAGTFQGARAFHEDIIHITKPFIKE